MTTLIVIVCALGYIVVGTAIWAFLRWRDPPGYGEGDGQVVCGIIWPAALPALCTHIAMKRIFNGIDAQRAKAVAESKELRRRLDDLAEEMRKP